MLQNPVTVISVITATVVGAINWIEKASRKKLAFLWPR